MSLQMILLVCALSSVYGQLLLDSDVHPQAKHTKERDLQSDIIDAAYQKTASVLEGDTCQTDEFTLCATARNSSICYSILCSNECSNEFNIPEGGSAGSVADLMNGENVARATSGDHTYELTLTGVGHETQPEESATLFSLTVEGVSQSSNLQFKVMSRPPRKIILQLSNNGLSTKLATILDNKLTQIAIVVDRSVGSVSVMVDGLLVYSHSGDLLSFNLAQPTNIYDYTVDSWIMYDYKLSTSQLLYGLTGSQAEYWPRKDCVCPDSHPAFVRYPTKDYSSWSGTKCSNLVEENNRVEVNRVPANNHIPAFLTDGDVNTMWISGPVTRSLIQINLGTVHEVYTALITWETLPETLLITRIRENTENEELLSIVKDNCGTPWNGLPAFDVQERDACKVWDEQPVFNGTTIIDWSVQGNLSEIINVARREFHQVARSTRKLFTQFVKFYLDGFLDGATRHAIREIKLWSSSKRKKRAAPEIPELPPTEAIPTEVPITSESFGIGLTTHVPHDRPNGDPFRIVYQYSCDCVNSTSGALCDKCDSKAYRSSSGCKRCDCGMGSSSESCSDEGYCDCNMAGGGKNTTLQGRKCNPYVSAVIPPYGPVAGGTNVTVMGGWLFDEIEIKVGGFDCDVSFWDGPTLVYCTVPERTRGIGTMPVYTAATSNDPYNVLFDYRSNPNITSIGQNSAFKSGGRKLQIYGTSLDSVAAPQLIVTVVCKSNARQINKLLTTCDVKTPTLMECPTPNFNEALRSTGCTISSGQSKQKKNKQKRKKRGLADTIKFELGFAFDGFDDFESLDDVPWLEDYAELFVEVDPEINNFPGEEVKLLDPEEKFLHIDGTNLRSGASMSDYSISIGDVNCAVVDLTDSKLSCHLPDTLPEPDADELNKVVDGKRLPRVLVKVGYIKESPGYVGIESPVNVLPIVLPIVFGVIVIVLVIIVVIYLRRGRGKSFGKRGSAKRQQRYVAGPHGNVLVMDAFCLDDERMDLLKDRMIPKDSLDIGGVLGQGQFGKVLKGTLITKSNMRRTVAVKTLKPETFTQDPSAVSNFLSEAILMRDFNHQNVLSLIGVVLNEQQIPMVVLPFMVRGDLKCVLKNETVDLTVGDLIHFVLQVAYGMEYLSSRKFIHRDLAARNCMVDENFIVKIADFGLSHDIYSQEYYRVQDKSKPLPVKWMAIESLLSGKYTSESDVWAFGVLIWEVLTRGATPYPGVANYEMKEHLKIGQRLSKPEYCPDEVYNLMLCCWDLEPINRPRFGEITETISAFLDDDEEYERYQTRDITDEYYLMPVDAEDVEYLEDATEAAIDIPTADYDCPFPVNKSPQSDHKFFPAEDLNKNNSNNYIPAHNHYTSEKSMKKGPPPKIAPKPSPRKSTVSTISEAHEPQGPKVEYLHVY